MCDGNRKSQASRDFGALRFGGEDSEEEREAGGQGESPGELTSSTVPTRLGP